MIISFSELFPLSEDDMTPLFNLRGVRVGLPFSRMSENSDLVRCLENIQSFSYKMTQHNYSLMRSDLSVDILQLCIIVKTARCESTTSKNKAIFRMYS